MSHHGRVSAVSYPKATVVLSGLLCGTFVQGSEFAKVHPKLAKVLSELPDGETVKAWVFFADKGVDSARARDAALAEVAVTYDPRAIERRRNRRTQPGLFDERDLPVAQHYIDAIEATGAKRQVVSRWLNGVSVRATGAQIGEIARLPFVDVVEPVRRARTVEPTVDDQAPVTATSPEGGGSRATRLDYGFATDQLTQINVIALHDAGYTGAGVVIGVIDGGFIVDHLAFNDPTKPLTVIAAWDFLHGDGNVGIEPGDATGEHSHGTRVLGTIGAYRPGEFVGGAFDASFILCKTEDLVGEYPEEEDYWVAGLEFIEANGGDVATSSLGYVDWYDAEDYDGVTAPTSIAVNIATANGLHCVKSGGNGGHDADPGTWSIDVPGDAFEMIAVGNVNNRGVISGSSSDGPTADGRVKPEVLAWGTNTVTVSPDDPATYVVASGTSFSAPLVASAVACLVQAHPTWTPGQMRSHLFHTADYFVANGTFEPTYVYGYGIVDALAALAGDCNSNGVDDETDIATETSPDCNGNGIPDECDVDPAGDGHDCNGNSRPDECDIADETSTDTNSNGTPDECEVSTPAVAPGLHGFAKNRYVSFDPNNGNSVAFQVELVSSAYFPGSVGVLGWAGEPDENDMSRIEGTPYFSDAWPAVIHLGDCEIVPVSTYGVRASFDGTGLTDPLL
ncbi:MAG: S8 family serine peptidase, partial [Planctomycetes bacterium]|nr:S8 family serine peptidase [Planctomycetota bacterium]